ncbi:hypothetical protein M407DRAFT_11812 [Tulasnella calospora MUT 4182]|uniref:Uncharacterized protein n=1 Tax=Tulasnella calospora MUT 4182 TaxID=1051891 RepID=A0A0C3Q546_9AGAM|nr:hypothetical protein M407DRAFT_11812 [Tulasnella calospora MUT 4182]
MSGRSYGDNTYQVQVKLDGLATFCLWFWDEVEAPEELVRPIQVTAPLFSMFLLTAEKKKLIAKLPPNIIFPASPPLPLKNGSSPASPPNDIRPKSGCTASSGVVKPPPPPPLPNPAVDRDEDAAESGGVSKPSRATADDGGGGDKLGRRNVKLHASLKWF